MSSQSIDPASPEAFASHLNSLFRDQRNSMGKRWTTEEIAERCKLFGEPVSAAYLHHLRNGTRSNPSPAKRSALAKAFGVPVSYFFTEGDESAVVKAVQDEAMRLAVADADVRRITLGAAELSERGKKAVYVIIQQLQEAGL